MARVRIVEVGRRSQRIEQVTRRRNRPSRARVEKLRAPVFRGGRTRRKVATTRPKRTMRSRACTKGNPDREFGRGKVEDVVSPAVDRAALGRRTPDVGERGEAARSGQSRAASSVNTAPQRVAMAGHMEGGRGPEKQHASGNRRKGRPPTASPECPRERTSARSRRAQRPGLMRARKASARRDLDEARTAGRVTRRAMRARKSQLGGWAGGA